MDIGLPDHAFKQPAPDCTGYAWKWGMMLLKTPFSDADIIQMLVNTPDKIHKEHRRIPDPQKRDPTPYKLKMPGVNAPITGRTQVGITQIDDEQNAQERASQMAGKILVKTEQSDRQMASKIVVDAVRGVWRRANVPTMALSLSVHYEYPNQANRHGAHTFGVFLDTSADRFKFFDPNHGSFGRGDSFTLFAWMETKFLIGFQDGSVRGDPGHAPNSQRLLSNFRVMQIVG
jgi:hypothetical protein